MALRVILRKFRKDWLRLDRLERQLKDYVEATTTLLWQRQAIFVSATLLTAFYFDSTIAFLTYTGVLFSEVLDVIAARRIRAWDGKDQTKAMHFLTAILVNTLVSSGAICLFIIMVAEQQLDGGHFTPLFFLFAAALFAAMNNHQFLPALFLRLTIYGATFGYIALMDILRYYPPIDSRAWLEFFTILFVMYFIIDISIQFLRLYRAGVRQLEELRREHERTLAALTVKSQFLSTVSHELRTPLTSIKGSLDLVNRGMLGPVPQTLSPVLEIAGKNSVRLANLIDDLLDLQKFEAGEMVFNFEPLSVNAIISDAIESASGFARSLGIIVTYIPEGEDLTVLGDKSRLQQVMANLLSNAVKFSREGGQVNVRAHATGDKVTISVIDYGVGIPAGKEDAVFGQFSQIDSSDQRKVGGTGLGMNISKQIVARHKGELTYSSTLGEGTTFFLTLDRAEAQ
ncbi:HAMP domain-containing histidine kinase [Thalassobius vesicularis]|uniref:histidine kinase n=1 Tax=Thalassobius vesicularis TaxID=1294297 RepID=A0A4S3MCE1_9RHOB|nr:HAMP domain-containing sensor histidine kinase [Thalassobius vesicularis]THD75045.1 HAMP domain-containing histidine kinase [Thalassobius vesicularis]